MMTKMFRCELVVLCLAALTVGGCSFASISSRPGQYSVSGYTTNPEMAMGVASDNYVQERNTDEYWKAVHEGRAYPYPSGGYGNDYWYYFGSQGYMPNTAVPQQPGVQSAGGDYATQEQLKKVDEKANDSLRMHRRLRRVLDEQQQGEGN